MNNRPSNDFTIARFESLEDRRLMSAGDLDPTFGAGGKVIAQSVGFAPADVAVQGDGKIVAVGQLHNDFAVARLNPNGILDTSFGGTNRGNGLVTTDIGDSAMSVVIQPDGRIIVAGVRNGSGDFALARFRADGTLDPSFDHDGKVTIDVKGRVRAAPALAVEPDGRILVGGGTDTRGLITEGTDDFAVARLFSDGSLDHSFGGLGDPRTGSRTGKTTFGFGGDDEANVIAVAPDGKIVIGGEGGFTLSGNQRWAIARLNANGTLDKSFGDGITGEGKFNDLYQDGGHLLDLSVQPDGSIVAVGSANADFAVARITAQGQLDARFGLGGHVETDMGGNDEAKTVRVTREGILVAGGSGGKFALARYKHNGSLDTSFGNGGKVITAMARGDAVLATSLTSDGKILAFGRSGSVARYISATPKVNVFSIDNTGSEQGPDNASFIVTRDAVYDFATRVFFDLSGTATFGQDYSSTLKIVNPTNGGAVLHSLIPGKRVFIDIPAGQSFVEVPINVNDDKTKEGTENVKLAVFDSPLYAVGGNRTSEVTIFDNDNLILRSTRRVTVDLFSSNRIDELLDA